MPIDDKDNPFSPRYHGRVAEEFVRNRYTNRAQPPSINSRVTLALSDRTRAETFATIDKQLARTPRKKAKP